MKNKETATILALAEFACELSPDKIPVSAYNSVKKCILDLVAVSTVGFRSPAARAVLDMSELLFSSGRSDVWFSGKSLNAPGADRIRAHLPQAVFAPINQITRDNATFKRLRAEFAKGAKVDWRHVFGGSWI